MLPIFLRDLYVDFRHFALLLPSAAIIFTLLYMMMPCRAYLIGHRHTHEYDAVCMPAFARSSI